MNGAGLLLVTPAAREADRMAAERRRQPRGADFTASAAADTRRVWGHRPELDDPPDHDPEQTEDTAPTTCPA
ncbi:hypothetical protein [Streptomyces sp. MBT53]|uniref:hypothetical protein n=1 Tax=Streptomyces sp. MBT53 TaxID=1488384 RepID=UPI001914195C|nr:hypothetical protein [Streptomyces sp. MBT53]MBK6010528.1 hypothetical protein [Streptomyces sp. MBT53]